MFLLFLYLIKVVLWESQVKKKETKVFNTAQIISMQDLLNTETDRKADLLLMEQ